MKKILALLMLLAVLLLCACTPNNTETDGTQNPDADTPTEEEGNPNLPFEGGHDPNGWT